MARPGIPLAPTRKRLLAFLVDLTLVGAALGASYCLPGFPTYGTLAFGVVFWGLYAVYQVATVLHPDAGIGKVLQGISVVSAATGQAPSLQQAVFRSLVRCAWALCGISFAKATDNDYLASLPVATELALVYLHPLRRTLADLAAGTVVIATPPVQPHRAPAAPMFSKNDAEFGHPPKNDG